MQSSRFDLDGKVAMVTGCNTGLGRAMALALAQAGADVVGVNRSGAGDTARLIKGTGQRFHDIQADLSSLEPINAIMSDAMRAMGQVDILVNNAGIIRRADALEFTETDWDDVIDTNLKTVFFLAQAFARQVIDHGRQGKIINIASMLSFQGGIRVPSYTASKSAVVGLTRLMACEWAARGINANAIAPGYIKTNNTEDLLADPKRSEEILARIPAGRWGEPDDLGGPAVFLASAASNYMHGHTIAVDGGWLAR